MDSDTTARAVRMYLPKLPFKRAIIPRKGSAKQRRSSLSGPLREMAVNTFTHADGRPRKANARPKPPPIITNIQDSGIHVPRPPLSARSFGRSSNGAPTARPGRRTPLSTKSEDSNPNSISSRWSGPETDRSHPGVKLLPLPLGLAAPSPTSHSDQYFDFSALAFQCQVLCRVRPLLPHEAATGASDCVHISPEAQTAHVSGGSGRDRVFDVTKLLGPDSSQRTVYDISTRGSVKGLFAGVNSAVIAYGQTGSGKTYSMEGAIGDDVGMGIVPRAIHDIHRMANAYNNDNCNVQLSVSMTEVYMERCVDLFAHVMSPRTGAVPVSTTSRPMRWGSTTFGGSTCSLLSPSSDVAGAVQHVFDSKEQLLAAYEAGCLCRHTTSTASNSDASRSHCVVTFVLTRNDKVLQTSTVSRMSLVDLGGTDRVGQRGDSGLQFEEGADINLSITKLGRVITGLTHGLSHIPFLDSKVTRLLKESLSGNTRLTLLLAVSPSSTCRDETVATFEFGTKAGNLRPTLLDVCGKGDDDCTPAGTADDNTTVTFAFSEASDDIESSRSVRLSPEKAVVGIGIAGPRKVSPTSVMAFDPTDAGDVYPESLATEGKQITTPPECSTRCQHEAEVSELKARLQAMTLQLAEASTATSQMSLLQAQLTAYSNENTMLKVQLADVKASKRRRVKQLEEELARARFAALSTEVNRQRQSEMHSASVPNSPTQWLPVKPAST